MAHLRIVGSETWSTLVKYAPFSFLKLGLKMAYYFKPKHAAWFVTNNAAGVCQLRETEQLFQSVKLLWLSIVCSFVCFVYILPLKSTPFCEVAPMLNLALRHQSIWGSGGGTPRPWALDEGDHLNAMDALPASENPAVRIEHEAGWGPRIDLDVFGRTQKTSCSCREANLNSCCVQPAVDQLRYPSCPLPDILQIFQWHMHHFWPSLVPCCWSTWSFDNMDTTR